MKAADDAFAARLRELLRVDEPLFLISQAQRSGGTLLLRLLDGHPQCNVVPFQLRAIDELAKQAPSSAEQAWQVLYNAKLEERFRSGHRQRKEGVLSDEQVFPFRMPPELQRQIYDACTAGIGEPSSRRFLECYFTSYFNAWLDYRNLSGPKRWVVAFEPGIARSRSRRQALRDLYPDGKALSIVRDPWSWYASARRWETRWREREHALDYWCEVGEGTIKWRRHNKEQVRLISFEDLLAHTEATVAKVADWLGLEASPHLTVPTFNGSPIRANTSFADVATEVSTRPLDRARGELDPEDVAYIDGRAGGLYKRLLRKVEKDWPGPS